jgi:trimeric autotransporter adhesin
MITAVAETGGSRFVAGRATRATDAALLLLEGIVRDRRGNLFLADPDKRRVRQVTSKGVVLTVAGPPELSVPTSLAVDGAGHLLIADAGTHRVLRLRPDGRVTTAAGTGTAGFSGDGGAATAAELNEPWGLAVGSKDHLFIADASNHRVRQVAPDGAITTVAGVGTPGFFGDGGAATAAQLDRPIGVAVDSNGNLFVVDSLNGRIRKVGWGGVITTVFVGAGEDRGAARSAAQYYPASVAVDRKGNLLIADPFRHRILAVTGVAAPGLTVGHQCPYP